MLSNKDIKLIKSLREKKFRQRYNLFVAEGVKIIEEIAKNNWEIKRILTTKKLEYISNIHQEIISEQELKKISSLKTPNTCIALCPIYSAKKPNNSKGLTLVLDSIRDPGNLGTIIRLADWFGVENIVCSEDCVDLYNQKVIQSTMGSFVRVNVFYTDLTAYLENYSGTIYGTFLSGKSIYKTSFSEELAIVIGNEANGISKEIESIIKEKISIPRFGKLQKTESLNAAMATGIILGEVFSQRT